MKLYAWLIAAALGAASASAAGVSDVKNVYVMPMANGLDQYLAIRLTTGGVLQVVTNPQKADAVLTDRIGAGFEQWLAELREGKPKDRDEASKEYARPSMQPLSHGKGAMFLVDCKTHDVLWSTYALSKSAAPKDMNHIADRIADRLQKDRKGK